MNLTTPVDIAPSPLRIDHNTPLLLMGSCFSDEIGGRLQRAGFEVLCNPFGTLYNPLSIAIALHHALDDREIDTDWLIHRDGLWHSWMHHSRFSHADHDTCLAQCNQSIHQAHDFLQRSPVTIITFGTAYCFSLQGDGVPPAMQGQVVANCHKLPAAMFTRRRITEEEIVDTWQAFTALHPTLFTVSPIRHMADGAHGNQLSKSTLLLAVDRLVGLCPDWRYFDSYEILMDELRDYRFYARDMCHPSDLAVDIVWQRFQDTYMSLQTQSRCRQEEKAARQALHRPIVQ